MSLGRLASQLRTPPSNLRIVPALAVLLKTLRVSALRLHHVISRLNLGRDSASGDYRC